MNEGEKMPHTLRVRDDRWKEIEKMAWKLSQEKKELVKPTDIADTILYKYTTEISNKDVEQAKRSR